MMIKTDCDLKILIFILQKLGGVHEPSLMCQDFLSLHVTNMGCCTNGRAPPTDHLRWQNLLMKICHLRNNGHSLTMWSLECRCYTNWPCDLSVQKLLLVFQKTASRYKENTLERSSCSWREHFAQLHMPEAPLKQVTVISIGRLILNLHHLLCLQPARTVDCVTSEKFFPTELTFALRNYCRTLMVKSSTRTFPCSADNCRRHKCQKVARWTFCGLANNWTSSDSQLYWYCSCVAV